MAGNVKRWAEYHKKILITAGVFSGVIIFGAWYLVSYLFILLKTKQPVTNPFLFFAYYKRFGFPWFVFLVFVAMGLFFILTTVLRQIKDIGMMDPERNIKYSKADTYGSAAIQEPEEVKEFAHCQHINEALGPIYGRLDNTVNKVINMNRDTRINKHTFVCGASQSGKTFCYVLPTVLQVIRRRESLIVTDPKGELYETTAEYAKKMGYVVRRFDLRNPELSDGWDCLKEILRNGKGNASDRAAIFSDIVIQNTNSGTDGGGDPIYTKGPKLLLKALLLRVALGDDLDNHFGTVIDIVKSKNVMDQIKVLFNDGTDKELDDALAAANNGLVRIPEQAEMALAPYNTFINASANLSGNLIIGLGARLEAFDSPVVKQVMSTDDIDMTLPGKQPCVYYVMMSDMHESYNFLGALFFSYLFLDLVEYADSLPAKRCPITVNFLLDEFANIGSIPSFEKKMAVIRSRALNVSVILQDIPQLLDRYPKTAASIMSNCATHLCIGFNDSVTEEVYSARSGDATIKVQTDQHKADESLLTFNRNHSTGDGRRPVFTPDELARFSLDECLLIFQSKNAMKLRKFPVSSHPEYKNLTKCSANDYPKISDTKARERLRKKEAAYVEEFNKWLLDGGDPLPYIKRSQKEKDLFVNTARIYFDMQTVDVSDFEEVFDLDSDCIVSVPKEKPDTISMNLDFTESDPDPATVLRNQSDDGSNQKQGESLDPRQKQSQKPKSKKKSRKSQQVADQMAMKNAMDDMEVCSDDDIADAFYIPANQDDLDGDI